LKLNLTLKLTKHELIDTIKQPPLLMLVILPIIMSSMIIAFMSEPGMDILLVPSWILFAQVMVGLMIIAPGFIEEKEQKTLDALLISPLSLREVTIAKCTNVLLFSILSQLFVYLLNLGFSSEVLLVFPIMVIGGILFIQVGMVIALLMNSSKTSAAVSSILMVVLFITASFYQQLPEWQQVMQFIPSVVVVENIHNILAGSLSLLQVGLLILWFVIFFVIIELLIRRELAK
jgi:ABC-2 type transport system permease protein